MLKHFLLLSQNAYSSRNDVTDASGTTTDPSQVNGTQDPLQSNNAPVHCTLVGSVATTLPGIPTQHVKTSVSSDVTPEPLPPKPNLSIVPGIMAQPFNTRVSSDVTPEPITAKANPSIVPGIPAQDVNTSVFSDVNPETITSQSNPIIVQNILAEPVHKSVSTVATLAPQPSTAQPIHTCVSTVGTPPLSAPQPKTSTVATPACHAVTLTTLAEHHGKLHLPPTHNKFLKATCQLKKRANSTHGHFQTSSQTSLMPPPTSQYEHDPNYNPIHRLLAQKTASDPSIAQQYMTFYNRGTPPNPPPPCRASQYPYSFQQYSDYEGEFCYQF